MSIEPDEGLRRIAAALQNFDDGWEHARQEIEAAVEVVLRQWEDCPAQIPCGLPAAIRAALNDTHGALAAHDEAVRAEHTEALVERLREWGAG